MAENIKAAAEQAYGVIVEKLQAPYFFEKLAANGIRPRNDAEAAELWELGQKLQVLYSATQEKAAEAGVSNLSAWNAELDAALASAGVGNVEKKAAWDGYAAFASEQPEIASAVLTLQAAAATALSGAN
jgi:hypothetical protein